MLPADPADATQKEALDRGQRISADWIGNAIKKDLPKIIRKEGSTESGQDTVEKD